MSSLHTLTTRNQDFLEHRFPGPLELRPRLRATIIGCLDPRVDPAQVLGLELGDAPVIRNIGGRITPAVLDILNLLALGFPAQIGPASEEAKGDLIVLHHNQCGITRMQGHPEQLAAAFGIDAADLAAKSVGDPHASLEVDVQVLRNHPGISDSYRVTGMFYDVTTGQVQITVPAQVTV
ncbi:carbonic anhydrase [Nakamurella sp. PAMC28650]|uniref:carbonic anhydrase n=1 Tax=Nakamurella sp. PAMC28650 TaxID=2762325 RepID=UPI00164EA7A7|nr:carbonic anhydrase [Nakamurella sp. PAMC28650]QNK82100.1 carbonic anhydrase [Nakamurella sp. PAMC28650]